MESNVDRLSWRLLPSEEVLWHGRKTPGVPRDRKWRIGPALVFAFATVAALFAALVAVADLPGVHNGVTVASYLALFGVALLLLPHYLLDGAEYLVTDRRIIWRRGRFQRSMNRSSVTYGRIVWHRSAPGVGHLELVCAVPFGPLARKQRILLNDVKHPDAVFARIRGVEPTQHMGDGELSLTERLDEGEQVLWGGHPEGWLLSWREIAVAIVGLGLTVMGLLYGHRVGAILLGLEEVGLPVRSWEWVLLFLAGGITWAVMAGVGLGLAWHGLWRARRLGRDTEYVLTDHRLLIRRGGTELSLDRRRIVDVADAPAWRGLHHLFLVLDAPESRALGVSGALGPMLPARDSVPPILYELSDVDRLKELILRRDSHPSAPSIPDAA